MAGARKPGRHPGSGGVPQPGEHYGVPRKPYVHGASRLRLTLCETCDAYLPPDHTCKEAPRADT